MNGSAKSDKPERPMKFGAAIWPFRWDPPYDEAIERIARLGFKAVELIIWDATSFEYYTPSKVAELRQLIGEEGLEISQLVHSPRGLASADKGARRQAIDSFKRAVDVGAALGADLINSLGAYPFDLTAPRMTDRPHTQAFRMTYPRDLDWTRNWEAYVDSIRQCTAAVEAAGMRYTIEARPYCWISNAASMLRLIEHVGSQALGMNFDPSHLFAVGEIPHAVIYQLGSRIFHCDLSDNDGETNAHWRPGKGKIDWSAVFAALADVGYDGVISIELEDVPGVARGIKAAPPAGDRNPTATDDFVQETVAAVRHIHEIACAQGCEITWSGSLDGHAL